MVDKLSNIDKLYFESTIKNCEDCKGIDYCTQELHGLIPTIVYDDIFKTYSLGKKKCHKQRGSFNDRLILEERYQTWEAGNKEEIIKTIKERKNIYLWGGVGKGKTHFLYWLSNLFSLKGQSVHVDLMSNIVRRCKQFDDREDYVDKLQTVDNLMIDDIGNEYMTQYTIIDILFPILDERYKRGKKTFITSNYTLNSLANMYAGVVKKSNDLTEEQALTKSLIIKSRLKTFGELEIKSKNWRI